jgi:hypothetical protein
MQGLHPWRITTMNTELELIHPIPLRAFLENGGDLREVLGDGGVACIVDEMSDARIMSPARRAGFASASRHQAEQVRVDGDSITPTGGKARENIHTLATHGDGWASLQQYVTARVWEADILDDPTLADIILPLLNDKERESWDRSLDPKLAGFPVAVQSTHDWWTCNGCLTLQDDTANVAMTAQVDGTEATYCFGCVTKVYEAMKAAQG